MRDEGDSRSELRDHEVAMGRSSGGSEVMVMDPRLLEVAARNDPGTTNINVTKSTRVHLGPKFVSITQNVDNTEVIKGRVLGLELVAPHDSKRLRCSIAIFVCWALVVASALAFVILYYALAKQETRLELDLPLPRYVWNIVKNTTKAEKLSCAAALIFLFACILLIVYFTVIAKKTEIVEDMGKKAKEDPGVWYINRTMWLAPKFFNLDEKTDKYDPLRLVIIAHTTGAECTVVKNCAVDLKNLQLYFTKDLGYDLPYNFLIGNDGRVYEGRGWNVVGAHTKGYNSCSLGIGFIGDYREGKQSYSRVTELQLQRAKMLLDQGVELHYLDPNYEVVGAKDLQITESPGENLHKQIKKWPHFAKENVYKNKTCDEIMDMFKNETAAISHSVALAPVLRDVGNDTTKL